MPILYVLTPNEQEAFDHPPSLSAEMRTICFSIDNELDQELKCLRTASTKVGFLLQYGYFKACRRFFFVNRFKSEDIEYAAKVLGLSTNEIDLSSYKKRMPTIHQKKILALFNYKPFSDEIYAWLEEEATRQSVRHIEPKQIFIHILNLLHQHKIEIPSYHCLAELITVVYSKFENSLLIKLKVKLTESDEAILDYLIADEGKAPLLSQLKIINQSSRPKDIQASLTLFNVVKEHFFKLNHVIEELRISSSSSIYYATWVQKAKLSQLKQFPQKEKAYLLLLAFIQHQFYLRQDYFVDILLKAVQSAKNTANKKLNESDQLTRAEKRKAVRHVTTSNRQYRGLIKEIDSITRSPVLSDTGKVKFITELLDEHEKKENEQEQQKVELFENTLDSLAKNKSYFDILENISIKLQRRISDVIKALCFNDAASDPCLIDAINHFKNNDGQIKQQAPIKFLTSEELDVIYDDEKKIKISLYKILLFMRIADAIKSGELNLKHSYRYKTINEYLIDNEIWKKNRNQLLKSAQLEHFSDYASVIEHLKKCLDEKYSLANDNFLTGKNPHLSAVEAQDIHVATPGLEDKDTEYVGALLEQAGYVPILQVLSDVEKAANFTECFKHHSIKHVKQRPNQEVFFAGIMGLGCNIGVRKMAHISQGIKENTLLNTVSWYLSLKNLQAANMRIVELINKLTLPTVFVEDKIKLHSSSDGKKFNVGVDSLIASRSFKYHGKDKGVSVYTFIDERQSLFHSLVMSSAEREAAYVIDGLLQNEITKTSIHSTDSHGYTETIFATTHFLDIAFAPRIKNIGKQHIYAFSAPKTYAAREYKILPSRTINQKLISQHWEDILRFITTIKLKETTASQLFKRLSSYAKDNPLYQALKEFGRIIKSIFILTYLDDVKLRQRVEKQLNRIELSNKFSGAVFFANNSEFKLATREEQEIASTCQALIQNSIVLWNYLYLSQLLANCSDPKERTDMVNMIKNCSIMIWRHINLHGEYDFRKQAVNEYPFDMAKILALEMA